MITTFHGSLFPIVECGGLNFLLTCDFKCTKLPIKLSNFHKQALNAWKLVYKHNFSPHSCVIWNNQYILFKTKTIFWNDWFNKGLIFVTDLMNQSGDLYNYNDLVNYLRTNISFKEYLKRIHCISPKLLYLIKNEKMYNPVIGSLPALTVDGLSIRDKKFNNMYIRKILIKEKSVSPKAMVRWKQDYHSLVFQNLWSDINKCVIPNKLKETHFKIINRYYPCNNFISKFKEGFSPLCRFCKEETETVINLFFNCNYTKLFWSQVSMFLFDLFYKFVTITDVMVLFMDCGTGLFLNG